jgi:transposase
VTTAPNNLPDEIAALTAALAAERTARQEAEARASSAEALVAHLKLLIAKLKREQYGQSSERGRRFARPIGVAARADPASRAECP